MCEHQLRWENVLMHQISDNVCLSLLKLDVVGKHIFKHFSSFTSWLTWHILSLPFIYVLPHIGIHRFSVYYNLYMYYCFSIKNHIYNSRHIYIYRDMYINSHMRPFWALLLLQVYGQKNVEQDYKITYEVLSRRNAQI